MNLATKITISRIMLVPVLLVLFFIPFPYHYLVTALVFVVGACTDFVDGYVARKSNTVTTLGKFLDPIADKLIVVVALFMIIGGEFLYKPHITAIVCSSLIMSRELIIDGFRLIAVGSGVVIPADKLGKMKTLVTDISIPLILCNLHIIISYIGWVLFIIGTILTIISGANYIIKNKSVLKTK